MEWAFLFNKIPTFDKKKVMAFSIKNNLLFKDGVQVPYMATPNKSSGTIVPIYVVEHFTADSNPKQTKDWFMRPESKVSAHLLIDRDGEVTQFVAFNVKAWHAGESSWKQVVGLNSHSIGIELTNMGKSATPKPGYVKAIHKNETTPAYWQSFTPKQIEVNNEVVLALRVAYGLKEVLGHDDIAPKRKVDPGPAFDMEALRAFAGFKNDGEYLFTTATLNLREGANTSHKIVSVLPKGTEVQVLLKQGEWYSVFVTGSKLTGWVNSKYLTK